MFWVPPCLPGSGKSQARVTLLLQGNPTSSYIWRNILPLVAPVALASHQISFRSIGKTRHRTECDQPRSTVSWPADLQVRFGRVQVTSLSQPISDTSGCVIFQRLSIAAVSGQPRENFQLNHLMFTFLVGLRASRIRSFRSHRINST